MSIVDGHISHLTTVNNYSLDRVVWDILIKSCMLPECPSGVYPNWSTVKIPHGSRISSWYSKISGHESPACLDYQGNFQLRNPFCLKYLTGVTRLLEVKKSSVFLSTLSSCRESPVHLIKEHPKLLTLQVLDKSSPSFNRTIESIRASL